MYKILFKNISLVGCMHVSNLLVPLLVLPWLVRHLGLEKYGLVIYSHSVMLILGIISEYGFGISAVNDIAHSSTNHKTLSKSFYEILFTKLFLSGIAFLVLICLIFTIPLFYREKTLLFWAFGILLSQILLVNWFFQALEKNVFILVLNTISKISILISIYFFVKRPNDYIYVNIIYSLSGFFIGLLSILIVHIQYKLHFYIPTFTTVLAKLKLDFYYFISSVSSTLTIASTPIILGFFTSDFVVIASFGIAEKIYLILRMIPIVIGQVVYPRIVHLSKTFPTEISRFYKIIILVSIVSSFLISIVLFINCREFVFFITQNSLSLTSSLVQLLLFVPIIYLVALPFIQLLILENKTSAIRNASIFVLLVKIITCSILTNFYLAYGATLSILLTETAVLAANYFYFTKLLKFKYPFHF